MTSARMLPTRLEDCGDVLTLAELAAVLHISLRQLSRLRQHGLCPVHELPQLPRRFAKVDVARFLSGERSVSRLRRVS